MIFFFKLQNIYTICPVFSLYNLLIVFFYLTENFVFFFYCYYVLFVSSLIVNLYFISYVIKKNILEAKIFERKKTQANPVNNHLTKIFRILRSLIYCIF